MQRHKYVFAPLKHVTEALRKCLKILDAEAGFVTSELKPVTSLEYLPSILLVQSL